jgi:hypothetical protein
VSEAWVEKELARQLRPVAAPDDLWDRIEERRNARPERRLRWPAWPIAAALMLAAGAAAIWQIGAPQTMEELAVRELRDSGRLDFRSEDPGQIRSWVRAKAGMDVELPRSAGREIRLVGCRMMTRRGAPVVAIAYRVAGDAATLLVSSTGEKVGSTAHRFAPAEWSRGARIFSWTMGARQYTIACAAPREPEAACLLCHSQVKL